MTYHSATFTPAAPGPGRVPDPFRFARDEPDAFWDRRRPPSPGERFPQWRVKKLEAFIRGNLEDTLTLEVLADLVGLSCRHFSRCCRSTFGVTSHTLVLLHRIERAQTLLRDTAAPLSQIAQDCGFADQAHFSRTFRQVVGASPLGWRRDNASSQPNRRTPA